MLILGLNGSPNKDGNTKFLLTAVLDAAGSLGASTGILELGELLGTGRDSFCSSCSSPCRGICYNGTRLGDAYELMKLADGFIFGSPVYFGSVSGQMKSFFDKTRKLRYEKAFYNKVASAVTVAGSRFGGQETAIKAMHDIMLVHGMIVVADGYYEDDCGHHGVCAQRPAQEDVFAIRRAEILAKRMVEVCKGTESLRHSGAV